MRSVWHPKIYGPIFLGKWFKELHSRELHNIDQSSSRFMSKLCRSWSHPHSFETHTIQVVQTPSRFYFVFCLCSSLEFGNNEIWKIFPVQQNMTKPMIKFETTATRMEALQLEVSCLSKFRIDNYEGQRCQLKK